MELKEVIKHYKSGNQIAQGILFDTFYRKMYHLAMRILFNHNDVEDVLILAFSKVLNSIEKFDRESRIIKINESE